MHDTILESAIHPADRHLLAKFSPDARQRATENLLAMRRRQEQRRSRSVQEVVQTAVSAALAAQPVVSPLTPQEARAAIMREAGFRQGSLPHNFIAVCEERPDLRRAAGISDADLMQTAKTHGLLGRSLEHPAVVRSDA